MKRKILIITTAFILAAGGCKIYEGQVRRTVNKVHESAASENNDTKKIEQQVRKELALGKEYKLIRSQLGDNMYNADMNLIFEAEDHLIRVEFDFKANSVSGMRINKRNSGEVVRFTKEQLRDTARKVIEERFKDKKDQLKETELEHSWTSASSYDYVFTRTIDGEIFKENKISIYISGATGEMIGYDIRWDDVKYNKKKSITDDEAMNIFVSEEQAELRYNQINLPGLYEKAEHRIIPGYIMQAQNSGVLDVNTEKFLDKDVVENVKRYHQNDDFRQLFFRRRGQGAQEEVDISKDKAADIITDAAKAIGIEGTGKIVESGLMKDTSSGIIYWSIGMDFQGNDVKGYVDADNGKLMGLNTQTGHMNKYDMLEQMKLEYEKGYMTKEVFEERAKAELEYGNITKEQYDARWDKDDSLIEEDQLEEKMLGYFKKLTGLDGDLKIEVLKDNYNVRITGFRKENGIPYYENGIKLIYNPERKNISSVELNWDYGLKFEKCENIISKEEAIKKYYNEVGIERKLIRKIDKKTGERNNTLILAYIFKDNQPSIISADGKKFYNSFGEYEKRDYSRDIKDIADSKYKKDINMLWKMGLVDAEDNLFRPLDKLNKYEAMMWITSVFRKDNYGYLNKNNNAYEGEKSGFEDVTRETVFFHTVLKAVKLDILEEGGTFNGNSDVTRMDLTTWIINGMGDKKLAHNQKLFGKDGYKKLGEFYGIINDDNAEDVLSREEAASVLYDFIVTLEENEK